MADSVLPPVGALGVVPAPEVAVSVLVCVGGLGVVGWAALDVVDGGVLGAVVLGGVASVVVVEVGAVWPAGCPVSLGAVLVAVLALGDAAGALGLAGGALRFWFKK